MTVNEALDLVTAKFPLWKFSKCIEYSNYFVFFRNPKSFEPGIAVSKTTSAVSSASPMTFDMSKLGQKQKEYSLRAEG